MVGEEERARRRAALVLPEGVGAERGYRRIYRDQVLQAEHGCDFRDLAGRGRE
jgi:dihydroxy-acid dehydratase